MDKQHQLLQQFNNDFHTKEALMLFLKGYLHDRIIENAISKKPVESLADAIIELEKAFEFLNDTYDNQQTNRDGRTTNTAK